MRVVPPEGDGGMGTSATRVMPKRYTKSQVDAVNNRLSRITIDDAQCGGRPCIRGMRIRVTDVLDLLSAGASFEEILEDYPFLEREDILASIEYAARQIDHPFLQSV